MASDAPAPRCRSPCTWAFGGSPPRWSAPWSGCSCPSDYPSRVRRRRKIFWNVSRCRQAGGSARGAHRKSMEIKGMQSSEGGQVFYQSRSVAMETLFTFFECHTAFAYVCVLWINLLKWFYLGKREREKSLGVRHVKIFTLYIRLRFGRFVYIHTREEFILSMD